MVSFNLKQLALSVLLLSTGIDAAPTITDLTDLNTLFGFCWWPLVRKEWRTLSTTEKKDYITAVKCLQKKPSKMTDQFPGAFNRFEDYLGTHIVNTDFKHFTGDFQPWHRGLVAAYERDLRSLCGYKGAQPYWDWTLDTKTADSITKSPIWDAETGFGGNGPYEENPDKNPKVPTPTRTGGGCVTDGPFKDMVIHIGPGQNLERNEQCLRRDWVPDLMTRALSTASVNNAIKGKNFGEFDKVVQGGVTLPEMTYHGGGHVGVGGELGTMQDVYSSAGDPLFYLHHANMDRIYWEWQKKDLLRRLFDISGPVKMFGAPFDFFGPVETTNVTLASIMEYRGLTEDLRIGQVMNIKGGSLCYDYQ